MNVPDQKRELQRLALIRVCMEITRWDLSKCERWAKEEYEKLLEMIEKNMGGDA